MKKIRNFVIGGIENKIINLVILPILGILAVFLAVTVFQYQKLQELVLTTNEEQQEAIRTVSGETMDKVIDRTLRRNTEVYAYIADGLFSSLANKVSLAADYAEKLYSNPGDYPARRALPPDPDAQGTTAAQLLSEKNTNMKDPKVIANSELLGNLSDILCALYDSDERISSCFIGTLDGLFLIADDRSGDKYDREGNIRHIEVRRRFWYTGAVSTGRLYFTGVEKDNFTNDIGIVCAEPVYVDGKLVAVVGADLFLGSMKDAVEDSVENGGFVFIVNQNGQVVFSPRSDGVFGVKTSSAAPDLRKSDNTELAEIVKAVLGGESRIGTVKAGNVSYYVCGSPLPAVGWAVFSVMDREVAELPANVMLRGYDSIQEGAVTSFRKSLSQGRQMMIMILIALFSAAAAGAAVLGKRIVRPLEDITKKVGDLGGSDLTFTMDDSLRTGDEIEVLAEAFERMSERTLAYVDEVKSITAEKERIGAELSMATGIQESQLPHIFPPYPNRKEFDLYASMTPAKEVGGDFYDFFLIDDIHFCMVMADVSGKGVPAALFMMISKTLIKNRIRDGESPGAALAHVNNQLMDGNEAGMFVTVWLAVLNLATGRGTAVNAGHEHPVLKRKDGQYELIKYRHSPAVATMEDLMFREHEFEMRPGDCLFVYTDGVTEATRGRRELFGTERMIEALNSDPDTCPAETVRRVSGAINDFVGGAEQFDDITMLCFKYNDPGDENQGEGAMKELNIDALVENLDQVIGFVDEVLEETECSPRTKMQIDVAVEEVFVNIAHYAYTNGIGKVLVSAGILKDQSSVRIIFTDSGIPYDPTKKEDPDVTLSAEEREIGGLGIYMTRKLMDDIAYERKNGRNILTLRKALQQ